MYYPFCLWRFSILVAGSCGRIGFSDLHGTAGDGGNSGDGGDTANASANLVFVTSTTQAAGSLGGLAGADVVCEARATAISRPGHYVAWLSTTSTSARDRVVGARGWIRLDGLPVADTAADVGSGRLLYPILLDDLGMPVTSFSEPVMTATDETGRGVGPTCSDFTVVSSQDLTCGWPAGGTGSWTIGALAKCDVPVRLYCFGIDRQQQVLVSSPPPHRLAFITTATFTPGGGLAAADALCASEATSLPGTYAALLATTTETAASRFSAGAPWYRVDGVKFSDDLVTLDAPVEVTATGSHLARPYAWSGGFDAGTVGNTNSTCASWTAAGPPPTGLAGLSSITTSQFFAAQPIAACGAGTFHLICLQH